MPVLRFVIAAVCVLVFTAAPRAQGVEDRQQLQRASSLLRIPTPAQFGAVDGAVDRGLEFLATQQGPNGDFRSLDAGQPGVTSLCVLAFLSRGHLPGEGPHGDAISRGVRYVVSTQMPDGLFSRERPGGGHQYLQASHAAIYNHAISGLMLSEVYGMVDPELQKALKPVIERAVRWALGFQPQPKRFREEEGAWRYLRFYGLNDADLSITSWMLMFLRSARNAGFEVASTDIDRAVEYVRHCFDPQQNTFVYEIRVEEPEFNQPRAMAGAGILALALAGAHGSDMALKAGDWMLERPFEFYDRPMRGEQWHVYSAFYCSQAMFQLGGRYWEEYYPTLAATIIDAQGGDGSWFPRGGKDRHYGAAYTTSLTILALTPPYQVLPIFQR